MWFFLLLLYNSEECGNKKNPHGIENLCKSFNKRNSFLFDVDCHIIWKHKIYNNKWISSVLLIFFVSHHIFLCLWFSKVCYSDSKVQVLLACFVEINFIGDFLLLRWCMQFYASIAQMEFSIWLKRKLR